ncbi:uncharacterized protein Eint_080060 [Encephalitozoon intestinalis ATCC 50506]|uniref:Uncharacterized protein n=1 Tax=Encephalitozoon intestinalis (strain ATCC 50506) TaxID=876142 RepID=E0S8E9_ENCIT|nr:uncharacterized protein Eint_080060 [Encephalitozoon intestinalis ATCC 50506]ADM11943.1 hypothetical protein Eint_080060 [Encephalitozoon intestinalis ATCC 50506]UTX45725.1 hypothetical protein GPK93_08g12980 [Encephalitozoon intestinalis]
MHFTLLYPEGEKWKEIKKAALKSVVRGNLEEDDMSSLSKDSEDYKNYIMVKRNYARVVKQIEKGEVYDFYSQRRRFKRKIHSLSEFNRFKVVAILKDGSRSYLFEDGRYKEIGQTTRYQRCPFCNENIASEEINNHLRAKTCNRELESDEGGRVTVIFDKGIRTEYESLEFNCNNVRMLKKFVYDKTGISVSKQEVYRGETVLKNSDSLGRETVIIKQKKRTQKNSG